MDDGIKEFKRIVDTVDAFLEEQGIEVSDKYLITQILSKRYLHKVDDLLSNKIDLSVFEKYNSVKDDELEFEDDELEFEDDELEFETTLESDDDALITDLEKEQSALAKTKKPKQSKKGVKNVQKK